MKKEHGGRPNHKQRLTYIPVRIPLGIRYSLGLRIKIREGSYERM
jgi:hypothetical protein